MATAEAQAPERLASAAWSADGTATDEIAPRGWSKRLRLATCTRL